MRLLSWIKKHWLPVGTLIVLLVWWIPCMWDMFYYVGVGHIGTAYSIAQGLVIISVAVLAVSGIIWFIRWLMLRPRRDKSVC